VQGASRESLRTAQERFAAFAEERDDAEVLRTVADQLFATVTVLTSQAALRRALSDPALPAERKGHVVESLFGEQLLPSTLDVLRDVVGLRWAQPVDMCDAVEVLAAQAAFTVAELEGRLDEVEDELFRFSRIVEGQRPLRAALTDPALPTERKVGLLAALLEDKVAPTTLQVLDYVVAHPRGRTFERAVAEFARWAAARRQRLIAHVTAARPLDDAQQERLARALQSVYGRQVQLQVEVDPSILGGLSVRIGDEVIDGSTTKRLDDVRRRLAG
jgi:F-type H+-transporting ATPase subunit delta